MNADPINAEGLRLIMSCEGCRLHAYQDIVGVWTIGYGHTGPEVVPGLVWTREQCDQQLADDLDRFEQGVDAAIGDAPTTDNQFAAMVSLAYNIGVGGFAKSSVAKLHVAGDKAGAADFFLHYAHAGGEFVQALYGRRQKERALYQKPDAPDQFGAQTHAARPALISWLKKELGL